MFKSARRSGTPLGRVAFRDELGETLTDYSSARSAPRALTRESKTITIEVLPRANFDGLVFGLLGSALRKTGEIQ